MERVTPTDPETDSSLESRPASVLVVDDDSRVVELLQITLAGRGYRVLTAHDGDEALTVVRSHRLDFVVLDVRLPRRSGVDVCESIRKNPEHKNLPIILISGNAATDIRLQGLRAGADDYMTKPFSPRELLLKMQRILERNRDRDLLALKAEVLEEEVRRQRDHLRGIRDDFQGHMAKLGTILEKIQELNCYHSIDEILQRFVLTAVGILDFASVALLLRRGERFECRVDRGLRLHDPGSLSFDPAAPFSKLLAQTDSVLAVDELALRPECRDEVGLLSAAGLIWTVGVRSEGMLEGILCIGERSDRQPLGRFDLRLLEVLATSVGTALANAAASKRTQDSFLETITTLLSAFESRHPWLAGHSERVRDWVRRIGEIAGLEPSTLQAAETAALLHNLGAVERHEPLLSDPVVLSPAERKMRQAEAGEATDRLLTGRGDGAIAEALRHQAEYWDGSGIPDGLAGDQIPITARILTIANAYDAMLHERPHRSAYSVDVAIELIRARAGSQFDPDLVDILVGCISASEVKLGRQC